MKHILSAVLLAVLGLAISASAGPADSQVDLDDLEHLLQESELHDEPLTDADFDDEDDRNIRRRWNPFAWFMSQFKNKCSCKDNKCDCCFKLKLFNKNACFSAEPLPEEKKVQINFTFDEKSMVNKQFDVERNDSFCGSVPVPALSFLKFCFNQQSDIDANSVITSCSNIEFKVGSTTGAVILFRCLEYKNDTFNFGGHSELEKSEMLKLQVKNPFKIAVEMLQARAG